MLKILPGVLLTVLVALLSKLVAPYLGHIGSVSTAIILGIIISNTVKLPELFKNGIKYSEKNLLNLAIILLGFNLQISALVNLGVAPLLVIIAVQTITILSGIVLGRLFGYSKNTSTLLGVGNAVCGSSAIAAVSPVIDADQSETGISIGVVIFLGTVGIFVLPVLAINILKFSPDQTATFIGGSLQAVGQVVASGFSVSDKVGELATIIKMARIVMLGPIVLIFSLLAQKNASIEQTKKKTLTSYLPLFVILFITFSIVRSLSDKFFQLPQSIWSNISAISKFVLTTAMVAIGMKIKLKDLLSQGPKAIIVGLLIMIIQLLVLGLLISTTL